ncbi:MAG: (deoxy)nucleoside triphosphate pyrophosphohydrolase [Opitutaceae bacterium]|jgi:8-oxo-dGTP diphosphatase|nr:(deoxy)nucleoside triphosphate pyrophosphohydrolase [Opitutaceae bacterium]
MELPSLIPVCCALIEHEDRVLIAQRPLEKHLGGQWEFPGGKMEPDESPTDALHREIKEELGCTLTITAALPPVIHTYPAATIQLHPFIATLSPDSSPPQAYEHVALKWLNRTELAKATLAPADIPVLDSYLTHSA